MRVSSNIILRVNRSPKGRELTSRFASHSTTCGWSRLNEQSQLPRSKSGFLMVNCPGGCRHAPVQPVISEPFKESVDGKGFVTPFMVVSKGWDPLNYVKSHDDSG